MPTTPTYPGVYIEEIPSGVRAITGVATSVAAFVDQFKQGPVNKAVQVLSFADFEREFGGLDRNSEASYAIQQFFLNGGNEAWVVRVVRAEDDAPGNPAVDATVTIGADVDVATPALDIRAVNPGDWGNRLRVGVEPVDGNGTFNLVVSQFGSADDSVAPIRQAVHRNVTMNSGTPGFVETVVNDAQFGSTLIHASPAAGNGGSEPRPPLANGTSSGKFDTESESISVPPSAAFAVTMSNAETGNVPATARVTFHNETESQDLALIDVAAAIEAGIRAALPNLPVFAGATVRAAGKKKEKFLWVMPGGNEPDTRVQFADVPGDPTARDLRLTAEAVKQAATLSGPLEDSLDFPPAPRKLKVTIGNMEKDVELTVPNVVSATSLAAALMAAIRAAPDRANNAFKLASVSAVGNRLLILPGTGNDPVTFMNYSEEDATASALLLTDSAAVRTATMSGELADNTMLPAAPRVKITIGETTKTILLPLAAATAPRPVPREDIAKSLHNAVVYAHQDPAFADALVTVVNKRLVILAGDDQEVNFADAAVADTTATALKLKDATVNVAEYRLGVDTVPDSAQLDGTRGVDGDPPLAKDLIGSPAAKTGIYALEDVDLFNILCIPVAAGLTPNERSAILSAAISYCERRRAFFLVDTPPGAEDPTTIKSWLEKQGAPRSRNAALYYPRVKVPDPLDGFRLRSLGASGSVAGVYARTDAARGVWKAPAGTEATLRNVTALDDLLTDGENGTLNPLAINCLRTFPIFGNVVWGARTLDGADQQASEWKYVPVRRLSLFLEESLYRGTKWVVFEPNGEPLWAQIRLNLGGFMHTLFRQGAFQGTTPRDAYFVKCDKETTTQNDIDLGAVNIVVGFAPLKPAEFVIIKFQQMAGQIAT